MGLTHFQLISLILLQTPIQASNLNDFDEDREVRFTVLWHDLLKIKNALYPLSQDLKNTKSADRTALIKLSLEFGKRHDKLDELLIDRNKNCVMDLQETFNHMGELTQAFFDIRIQEALEENVPKMSEYLVKALVSCF